MTMISTKLAGRGCIRSGTLAGGRIQHTRIYDHHGGIDIINVYQRVWSHGTVDDIKAQRKKVWDRVGAVLG